MASTRQIVALSALVLLASGVACSTGPLMRLTRPSSPHEAYVDALRGAGLDRAALGRDWVNAAARALEVPVEVTLPFRESGYFPPDKASAVAYRFSLRRGRALTADASFETVEQGRLFVDLFRVQAGGLPERVNSIGADATTLTLNVDEDGEYVLRVQPELLRGGRFNLVARTLAELPFPVAGLSSNSVRSGFGAERDAGIRQHEGVDIFAAAGTPVVAVTSGVAQASTNNLGGNVVWLQDARRRRTYYYAHLERTALTGTSLVEPGEVLGYVGNTGNARTTAPHLHFGIYAAGGAIDPLPFIEVDQDTPPAPDLVLPLGALARVRTPRTPLQDGTAADASVVSTLPRATLVTVLGATGRSVRVELPDDSVGYLPRQSLTAATAALSRRPLATGAVIRERPFAAAAVVHVVANPVSAEVIGSFAGYDLIRAPAASGWVVGPSVQ